MKRIILTAALALLACATAQAQQMAEYNNEKGLYLGIGASSRNLDSLENRENEMVNDPDSDIAYLGIIGWRFSQYFDLEARVGATQEVCGLPPEGYPPDGCRDEDDWLAVVAKARFPFGTGAMRIAPYVGYGQYREVPDYNELGNPLEESQKNDTRARIFGLEIDFLSRLSIRFEQREDEEAPDDLDPIYTLGILYHF